MSFKLGSRQIGPSDPAYVIAEAGVNHNGDIGLALQLVDIAAESGADCVKFQTFRAEMVATAAAPKAAYQLKVTVPSESQVEMLRALELDFEEFALIREHCDEIGIDFLSTPYSPYDADFLDGLGMAAFKVASGQIVEHTFLRHIAGKGKPVIISTGMARLAEVAAAVDVLRDSGCEELVVLQCTTNYPAAPEDANLRAMVAMGTVFGCLYGYSDHIPDNYSAFAAVALGATVVEKHFTLDRSMPGPDHSTSLEPAALIDLIGGIRHVESALGSAVKRPSVTESANIRGMRRGIVATASLLAGTVIEPQHLTFKRPSAGLNPTDADRLIGLRLAQSIDIDQPITAAAIDWSSETSPPQDGSGS